MDWTKTPPSIAIVSAIAAIENVDPMDLPATSDVTLYTHVNPDALDTIAADERRAIVSFPVGDYLIRIDGSELTIADA
jgi:hypothetical protein